MPSIRSLLIAVGLAATVSALPRPQDPSDPQEPLPTFPGDGISYIGNSTGTITAYAYSGGPAYGCLDATGHVTKPSTGCATFTAVEIYNSTYGSTIATTNGPCAFNPEDGYKFQCKDLGDVKPTGFYQIGTWLAHSYYKDVSYEAYYEKFTGTVDEIVSVPSSGPVQYQALFKYTPTAA